MKTKQNNTLFFTILFILLYPVTISSQITLDTNELLWPQYDFEHLIIDTLSGSPEVLASEDDILTQTLWVPEAAGSTVPYDLLSLSSLGKLFVFGDRNILVIDQQSHQIIDQIELSEFGSHSLTNHIGIFPHTDKHLAYNVDEGLIFCVDENLQLFSLDPASHSLSEVSSPVSIGVNSFTNTIIKYNELTGQLFWVIASTRDTYSELHVFSFSGGNLELDFTLSFANVISDLAFHPEHNKLYITVGDFLKVYNAYLGTQIAAHNLERKAGKIIVAHSNVHTVDKVFAVPFDRNGTASPYAIVLDGSTNNKIHEIPLSSSYFTTGYYNAANNLLFLGHSYFDYNETHAGIYVFNAGNYFQHGHHLFNNENEIVAQFNASGEKTIAVTKNRVIFYNDYAILSSHIYDEVTAGYFYRTAVDQTSNIVYVTSSSNASVNLFSLTNYEHLQEIIAGSAAYKGLYCSNKKLYLFNSMEHGNSKLTIYNTVSKEFKVVDVGYWPTSITYNETDNELYVSNFSSTEARIKILDGNTDVLNESGFVVGNYIYCEEMLWLPGNRLYLSVTNNVTDKQAKIVIYDLNNHTIEKVIAPFYAQTQNGFETHFLYDSTTNKVISSIKELCLGTGLSGKILVITNDESLQFPVLWSPPQNLEDFDKVRFNPHNGIVYSKLQNNGAPFFIWDKVAFYNINANSINYVTVKEGTQVADIEYSEFNNELYCSFYDLSGEIYRLDGTTGEFLGSVRANGPLHSLKFNKINRRLYGHVVFNKHQSFNRQEEIFIYNTTTSNTSYISLEQSISLHRSITSGYLGDIILNTHTNQLYHSSAHSNIKEITCTEEQLQLRPGVTWFSFPKLDQQGMSSVTALTGRIDPDIGLGEFAKMEHNLIIPGNPNWSEIIYIEKDGEGPWDPIYGQLYSVNSKEGYIMEIDGNATERTLELTGNRLPPDTPIDLYTGVTNWVGYFPTWSQSPFDALADILDELTMIEHQDYFCIKDWGYFPPDGNLKPYWICEGSKGGLEYGDMLKLECSQDVTFQWGGTASDGILDEPEPEYFSFTEEPDYTPIVIDLDTTENPQEIGAFINDTCIGACVVMPDDTVAGIQGYIGDLSGEITFEEYHGSTRSTPAKISSYMVYEPDPGVKTFRTIHTSEKKKFYHVSFKNPETSALDYAPIAFTIHPNPCSSGCGFDYSLPFPSEVLIEIFDVTGRKIREVQMGNQPAGSFQYHLQGELEIGVFFIRLTACGSATTQKLVITN